MAKTTAALGVRAHSGWAAYVVLGGDARAPDILGRGRMTLCDSAETKMPFHAAEPMAFARGEAFIAQCRAVAAKLADREIEGIGAVVGCCVLAAAGKPLPDLRTILASHALIHAAEGEFYRDAIAQACSRAGIAVTRIRERDVEAEAGHLGAWRERLAAFGKTVGPPWTQDEKLASLGAWLVLAAKRSKR
ncbi:MAG: hypothetical protein JOZ72_14155 [Alphaproteobacteria bacterium]|nr:hypothetical protein [Alphaproteobacteria bacterium]